jgi:hypothetical protein
MNSQPVEALEVVVDDLREAWAFYESWRSDGRNCFQTHFRDTVEWIEWNPELFPKKFRAFRRAIIRNTYFGIFFVIEPQVTTISPLWICDVARLGFVKPSFVDGAEIPTFEILS